MVVDGGDQEVMELKEAGGTEPLTLMVGMEVMLTHMDTVVATEEGGGLDMVMVQEERCEDLHVVLHEEEAGGADRIEN